MNKEKYTLPNEKIAELESFFQETDRVIKKAQNEIKTIEEQIVERENIIKKLKIRYKALERGKKIIEKLDQNLDKFSIKDFEHLKKEKIITSEEIHNYEKMLIYIKKLEELKEKVEPTNNKELLEQIDEKLKKANELKINFENKIGERIQEFNKDNLQKRNNYEERIARMYQEKIKPLEERLVQLESKPEIIAELNEQARKEMNEFKNNLEKYFKEQILPPYHSIQSRHDNSFQIIEKITGQKNIKQRLFEAFETKDKNLFRKIQDFLLEAIKNGTIKDIKELIPWYVKSKHHYGDSLSFLSSKKIKKIIEQFKIFNKERAEIIENNIDQLLKENQILRILFSKKFLEKIKIR